MIVSFDKNRCCTKTCYSNLVLYINDIWHFGKIHIDNEIKCIHGQMNQSIYNDIGISRNIDIYKMIFDFSNIDIIVCNVARLATKQQISIFQSLV
jgi:hypothetical protein